MREQLKASILCQRDKWPDDVDDMAAMYETELNSLFDRLIQSRVVTYRPRPSDPWFVSEKALAVGQPATWPWEAAC